MHEKLNILYVFYIKKLLHFHFSFRIFFLIQFQSIKRNLDIDTKLEKK